MDYIYPDAVINIKYRCETYRAIVEQEGNATEINYEKRHRLVLSAIFSIYYMEYAQRMPQMIAGDKRLNENVFCAAL